MDRISINGLVVEARIGVTPEERAHPQALVVDVEVATDLARAGRSDDLADTIDYDQLTTKVAALVRQSECHLLESVATQIAGLVSALPGVFGVTVSVLKQVAPVDEEVSGIAVQITRGEI